MAQPKSKTFSYTGRIAWRKVADEAVILDTETAAYYSLQDVGLRIWELIGQGRSVEEMAVVLAEEYDVSEDVVRRDCKELIGRLRREKIIEPA